MTFPKRFESNTDPGPSIPGLPIAGVAVAAVPAPLAVGAVHRHAAGGDPLVVVDRGVVDLRDEGGRAFEAAGPAEGRREPEAGDVPDRRRLRQAGDGDVLDLVVRELRAERGLAAGAERVQSVP